MKDIQLYQQILGDTTPWRVAAVRLDAGVQTIEIEMALKEGVLWGCPECGGAMHMHDQEQRRWRHLDTCQFKTFVVADAPRVNCPAHGKETVFHVSGEQLAAGLVGRGGWDQAAGRCPRAGPASGRPGAPGVRGREGGRSGPDLRDGGQCVGCGSCPRSLYG